MFFKIIFRWLIQIFKKNNKSIKFEFFKISKFIPHLHYLFY